MGDTEIAWTRKSINPGVFGCSADGAECTNCYAEVMAARQEHMAVARGQTEGGYIGTTHKAGGRAKWKGRVTVDRARVAPAFASLPVKGCAVFVTSMADLHHDEVPYDYLELVYREMEARPRHWFQVLTKRPHNAARFLYETGRHETMGEHIWIGTTAGDPKRGRLRLHNLGQVPAANLFVSMEPLLGAIDPSPWLGRDLTGGGRIRWVIAGGESGTAARPSHPEWFRTVRDACTRTSTSFFFKQWGSWTPAAMPDLHEANAGRQVCFRADGREQWAPSASWTFATMERTQASQATPKLDGVVAQAFPEGGAP